MTASKRIESILPASIQKVNWWLLLFLVLVLNVKMVVKVIAILLFACLNYKQFAPQNLKQKFILFYGAMIAITVFNAIVFGPGFSAPYLALTFTGIGFWMLCAMAAIIIAGFVRHTDIEKLHATVQLFFIINSIVSLAILLLIIVDAGSFNPYTYQGQYQKYFISTGDRITGISFDTSTTNAIINAFGVLYFLMRRNFVATLLCMVVLTLASSNFTNILLIGVLLLLFIFNTNRSQKSLIVICFAISIIFLAKTSPQNRDNALHIFQRITGNRIGSNVLPARPKALIEQPDSILNSEQKKQKFAMIYLDSLIKVREDKETELLKRKGMLTVSEEMAIAALVKPSIPKPNIHSAPYQMNTDTTALQKRMVAFAIDNIPSFDTNSHEVRSRRIPGKVLALRETYRFFKEHPEKIITGYGTGQFSSKLAFRATGLQMSGGYPNSLVFIDSNFKNHHLDLYITYFSKHKELHSLINSPNSVYDQLIGEYGIAGVLAFVILYLAFFGKKLKRLTYGVPVLIIMLGAFAIDYWYEQLSVVIVFELMLLINIKETEPPPKDAI